VGLLGSYRAVDPQYTSNTHRSNSRSAALPGDPQPADNAARATYRICTQRSDVDSAADRGNNSGSPPDYLFAWLIATRWRKFSFFRMMGWQRGGFAWWHYIVILVAFFMMSAVVSSLVPEQDNDLIRMLKSSRSAVYIVAFVATFTAPFVEEVVYRGMLYSAFQRAMGIPAAFILTTFLFALVHVPQYFPSYSTIFLLTVLSLTLTAIRVKTDNLMPCVVLHTLFNGIQSMFLLMEPLTRQPVPDPIGTLLGFY
jgi:membrane protease YdiL (CAAX protease family)